VAGTADYLIFTMLLSRPGWLIIDGDPHGEYHKIHKDETLMFAKTQTCMKIILKHEWFHPTFEIKIIYG